MRSRAFRQKPWNKVTRMEKFWAVPVQGDGGTTYSLTAASSNATWCVNVSPQELAIRGLTASAGGQNAALQHVKIHRIQGHIWAWLDPTTKETFRGAIAAETGLGTGAKAKDAGEYPHPNISMVTYVWLKLKADANTPSDPGAMGVPGDLNPTPNQDLGQLLLRDDILAWGSVPVFGILPRIWNQALVQLATNTTLTMQHGPQAQYFQDHVAKIPTPRIPKLGLNLKNGERLVCAVGGWPGPGGDSNGVDDDVTSRDTMLYPQLRYFCSL